MSNESTEVSTVSENFELEIFKEDVWSNAISEQKESMLQDKDTIDWFKENFSDPNAISILQKVFELDYKDVGMIYLKAIQTLQEESDQSEPFIKGLIDVEMEASLKDTMMTFVIAAFMGNISEHYEHILLIRDLLPNEEFIETRKMFFKCDAARLKWFKECITEKKCLRLEFRQEIFNAMRPSFTNSKKHLLDVLLDDRDFTTLNMIFDALRKIPTSNESGIVQCDKLADKYLNKLTYHIYKPADHEDENLLVISVLNVLRRSAEDRMDVFEHLAAALAIEFKQQLHGWDHSMAIADLSKRNCKLFAKFISENRPELTKQVIAYIKDPSIYFSFLEKLSNHLEEAVNLAENSNQAEPSEASDSQSIYDSNDDESAEAEEKAAGYFSRNNWNDNKKAITDKVFGETVIDPAFTKALNHLARHAHIHLDTEKKSPRAIARQTKYTELETLFNRFANVNGGEVDDRLENIKGILEAILDKNPAESDLLKNRKGFFGAYEKMGQLLSRFSSLHYRYEHGDNSHTAVSSTDHYLMELYDAVNKPQAEDGDISSLVSEF